MRIVYSNPDGSVAVLTPSDRCLALHTLLSIALKDVPGGLPFWLVGNSAIPVDRTFRNAWEVPEEWGEPDGYGSEHSEFGTPGEDAYA